jgi:tetratricopeptide (TPR) repeat protein
MSHGQSRIRYLGSALVGTLLFATGTVALADVKYTKKTSGPELKQTDATKKLEARKKAPKEKDPAPEITADQFMHLETEVQNIRDEQIEEFKELIQETEEDDPERPDLLFRLAELYAGKQRFHHFQAMEAAAKEDRAKTSSDKGKFSRAKKTALEASTKQLGLAVKIYKGLTENAKYKAYPRMDEALFYYAFALSQVKDENGQMRYGDQARDIYKRLIKDHSSSKYIPDAYLSFAEYYFYQKDMDTAEKFYDKVLQFPKSGVYIYAQYMKGWVYFNQGRHEDSLDVWFKVAQTTQNDKRQSSLNRVVKKDYVRAYAEVGKVDKAYQAFQRVDPDYAFKMLEFLGAFYLDQGKADKTIYLFRHLMELDPKNKSLCEWQYTVVRATLTIGNYEQKVKELERLVKLYKYLSESKDALSEAALSECHDNAQATTGELAMIWHQEAQKTLNFDTLGYAQLLYKLYVEYFPEAENVGDMQYWYAEVLWLRAEKEKNPSLAASRWEDAAHEYTRVVEGQKLGAEKLKEAAYAAVLAWKNALSIDPKDTEDPKVEDKDYAAAPKPDDIPEKQQKMIAAFDLYIKYVTDPKDEELIAMKFIKGRTFWRYKHFDEAIVLFEEIIKTRPDHETAEFAVTLLLDSLARSGKTEVLVEWVDRLLAMSKFIEDKPEMTSRLQVLKRTSMRKSAEKLEADQRHRECGFAYEKIYQTYPEGDGLDEVLFNAAVCFEKARLIGRAIHYRSELIVKSPTNPLAQKAQYALGVNYAAIAYYDKAAEQYETYAKKFGGEKDASAALSSATFLRKGLGQDDKAIDDTNFFVKQYSVKQPKEAASAVFSIAGIYEKRQEFDNVVKHLTSYLKAWGTKGGVDRQIIAHVKIGEILWKQSCPVKGVNGACLELRRERALKEAKKKGKKKASDNPTQCGPATKNKIVLHERKPALVKEAQSHFASAIKLYKNGDAAKDVGGKDDTEKAVRTAEMIHYVAEANFYLAEDKYEKFLAIKFPDKLDFDQSKAAKMKDSVKRFKKWMDDKQKSLGDGEKIYMHVVNDIKGGGAAWAIASAARVGQLYQNFSDALFTAEIPKDLQKEDYLVEAYCDAVTEQADPLEERSIQAFSFCLDTSTGLNWFNEWSKLCEGELAQIRPQDFPSASEIRAQPSGVPMTLDVQPIMTELDPGRAKTAVAQ